MIETGNQFIKDFDALLDSLKADTHKKEKLKKSFKHYIKAFATTFPDQMLPGMSKIFEETVRAVMPEMEKTMQIRVDTVVKESF